MLSNLPELSTPREEKILVTETMTAPTYSNSAYCYVSQSKLCLRLEREAVTKLDLPSDWAKVKDISLALSASHDIVLVSGAGQFSAAHLKQDGKLEWATMTKLVREDNYIGDCAIFLPDNMFVASTTSGIAAFPSGGSFLGKAVRLFKSSTRHCSFDCGRPTQIVQLSPDNEQPIIAVATRGSISFLSLHSSVKTKEFEQLCQLQIDHVMFAARVSGNNEMRLAVLTKESLIPMVLERDGKSVVQHDPIPIDGDPKSVSFLSDFLMIVSIGPDRYKTVEWETKEIKEYQTKNQCDSWTSNEVGLVGVVRDGFVVVRLGTFAEIMAVCRDNARLEDAMALADAVMKDPTVCVGLAKGDDLRFQVDSAVDEVLRACAKFGSPDEAKATLQKLFKRAQETGNPMLILQVLQGFCNHSMNQEVRNFVLEEVAKAKDLIDFTSCDDFVSLVLEQYTGDKMDALLRKQKGGPFEKEAISLALDTKRMNVLQDLMDQEENVDLLASVAENNQDWDMIIQMIADLTGSVTTKGRLLSQWILSQDQHGNFPRLQAILEKSQDSVLSFLYAHVGNGQVITVEIFINILVAIIIRCCNREESNWADVVYTFVVNELQTSSVSFSLNNSSVKFFLGKIFSAKEGEREQTEQLLIAVINRWDKPNPHLVSFCEKREFFQAKTVLQKKLEQYEQLLIDSLTPKRGIENDIFKLMTEIIGVGGKKALDAVKGFVCTYIGSLMARDINALCSFLLESFPETAKTVADSIGDTELKFYFIYALFTCLEKYPHVKNPISLQGNDLNGYIGFMCQYHPNDLVSFLMKQEIKAQSMAIDEWRSLCQRFNAKQGRVYIADITNDSHLCEYVVDYTESILMDYIIQDSEEEISSSAFLHKLDFLLDPKDHHWSRSEFEGVMSAIIQGFLVPLSILVDKEIGGEKLDTVTELLRTVAIRATSAMSFDKLLALVIQSFPDIPIALLRKALSSVIDSYDYDIETKRTLVVLFKADEQNAHERAIRQSTAGVRVSTCTCQICHKPLNMRSCPIRLFPCGHVFHCVKGCLDRDDCPICNPTERIESGVKDSAHDNQEAALFRLRKFEYRLRNQPSERNSGQTKGEIRISDSLLGCSNEVNNVM